jgi:type I restriction enzyme M protein
MEACIVICRTSKPSDRQRKILFIDAVNEVARVQAQSFLKEEHQSRILNAYKSFLNEPGFATVAALDDVATQDYSFSIPLYVRRKGSNGEETEAKTLKQVWVDWENSGRDFWQEMDNLVEMLDSL